MKKATYLINRLTEVLTDGTWVAGANVKKEIIDLNWEDATYSISGLNSIARITFHLQYYMTGMIKVLQGEPLDLKDALSFEGPSIDNAQSWNRLVDHFCANATLICKLLNDASEDMLQADFDNGDYGSLERNLDVMIEHSYYHLGQIVLIKKMMQKERDEAPSKVA